MNIVDVLTSHNLKALHVNENKIAFRAYRKSFEVCVWSRTHSLANAMFNAIDSRFASISIAWNANIKKKYENKIKNKWQIKSELFDDKLIIRHDWTKTWWIIDRECINKLRCKLFNFLLETKLNMKEKKEKTLCSRSIKLKWTRHKLTIVFVTTH